MASPLSCRNPANWCLFISGISHFFSPLQPQENAKNCRKNKYYSGSLRMSGHGLCLLFSIYIDKNQCDRYGYQMRRKKWRTFINSRFMTAFESSRTLSLKSCKTPLQTTLVLCFISSRFIDCFWKFMCPVFEAVQITVANPYELSRYNVLSKYTFYSPCFIVFLPNNFPLRPFLKK